MTTMQAFDEVQSIDTATLSGAIETLDRDAKEIAGQAGPSSGEERLAADLNDILDTMRAFAMIAKDSVSAAPSGRAAEFVSGIEQHAERWAQVLAFHIRALGFRPSATGKALHAEAMGIENLHSRLVFINHRQHAIVKQLNQIITVIRDDALYVDLTAMRRSHEERIGWMNASLGRAEPATKALAH